MWVLRVVYGARLLAPAWPALGLVIVWAVLAVSAYMRNIALGGDFSSELNALMPQVGASDRILTYDQRLRFFYRAQVDFAAPRSCRSPRAWSTKPRPRTSARR